MAVIRPRYVGSFQDIMKICQIISDINDEEATLDITDVPFWTPFAALCIIGYCKQAELERGRKISAQCLNDLTKGYLDHVRFFKILEQLDHKTNRIQKSGENYVAITVLNRTAYFNKSAGYGEEVFATIQHDSSEFARLLLGGISPQNILLSHAIREVIRNAIEHSQSENVLYFGQRWPNKKRVQVCILDNGVGIRTTISKNPKLEVNSYQDALKLSLLPGISGTPNKKHDGNISEDTKNSGFGLYIVSELCRHSSGFLILSGGSALSLTREKDFYYDIPYFHGTIVRIDLKLDNIQDGRKKLAEIVAEGERRAKLLQNLGALSPSKASSMLRLSSETRSLRSASPKQPLTFSQDE